MKKMKNKIFLLLIIFITSNSFVFAGQEPKVISDSASQKELNASFNEVNQYTGNFFTPVLTQQEKDAKAKLEATKKDGVKGTETVSRTVYPVKRLRLRIQNGVKPKAKASGEAQEEVVDSRSQAILDCETMQYFAEKTELQADGHVVMVFPKNNSSIKADKVVYNQSSNLIKAYGNVVLINDGKELFGDYMQIDMNEENGFMDNPASDLFQIRCRAKKGYMYGDKIIQEQGSLYVTKKTMINLKAEMFGPDLDTMYVSPENKSAYMKDSHGEKFRIKTNDLIINAKKDHDTITLRHAEIYFNERKVGTVPTITMHTDKNQNYVEADFPEIGTMNNMGLFAGPGFVFDTPGGTTLKVVPILNYQSNGADTSDNKMGFGALAKFKSASNKTDIGYGTANNVFIMRGLQKLDDNLFLQYASNAFMDDWFMGFRMPKLMGELVYHESFPQKDFLGKDKTMIFSHRLSGAYLQDGNASSPILDSEGAMGTMRVKYMAEAIQTLFSYKDPLTSPINARFDIIGQGSSAVYGTGGTQMIARIGPRLHSQYHNWMQDVGYFLSGYNDQTPMVFDRYMYGRSNAYLRESYRLCKYLTVSWFGSLNLSNDSWDGKMLQENGFYFAIGPDDIKLNIGYDTVRQQSFVTMAMHLDAKGSTIEYKKMVIKNPESLGKKSNGESQPMQGPSSSFLSTEDDGVAVQRAEVVDIPPESL